MNAVTVLEEQAAEHSHRILDLMSSGRREELATFMDGLTRSDLAWVVLAVGQALLEQEARCDELEVRCGILTAQNRTLEEGNAQLFRERRVLSEKLEEWRRIGARRDAA